MFLQNAVVCTITHLGFAGSFPDLSLKKETDILCADTHQFIHAHFRESEVCILSGNYY